MSAREAVKVNVDASYDDGVAGIAFESSLLGCWSEVVDARSATHAEFLALLAAMNRAREQEIARVDFRTDCPACAEPWKGGSRFLAEVRALVRAGLGEHPQWRVVLVLRTSNVLPHKLARRALLTRRMSESAA